MPAQTNEKLKTLENWSAHLIRIRDSMRNNGEDVLADHIESIVDDLEFQYQEEKNRQPIGFWRGK